MKTDKKALKRVGGSKVKPVKASTAKTVKNAEAGKSQQGKHAGRSRPGSGQDVPDVPNVPKDPESEKGVRWCVTYGWGDTGMMVKQWTLAKDEKSAYDALSAYARKEFQSVFEEVWTQTFVENGVVCDFGSHVYFGFIEGVQAPYASTPSYAVANGVPEELKPEAIEVPRDCTVHECLASTWGVRLQNLFQGYLQNSENHGAAWLAAHALEYCCVSEWWGMFCQDDPDISPVWENDMSPEDVYKGVSEWARNSTDAPEILLMNSPDAKWEAFRHALLYGAKRP